MVKFFILPLKWMLIFAAIAAAMAAGCLVFMNNLILRWLLCAVIIIPMLLLLIKDVGGVKALFNSILKKES